jgi:hypothetical protein
MVNDWGPHYIVPSEAIEKYSGFVQLRESLDEDLLDKELDELGIFWPIIKISNPWYYRMKGAETWIKIGESEDKQGNFPVGWDTAKLQDGQYEIMGLMHVYVKKGDVTTVIARQNIVEIAIAN